MWKSVYDIRLINEISISYYYRVSDYIFKYLIRYFMIY